MTFFFFSFVFKMFFFLLCRLSLPRLTDLLYSKHEVGESELSSRARNESKVDLIKNDKVIEKDTYFWLMHIKIDIEVYGN